MQGLPEFVRACCARLWAAGFEACPVGGCVRDLAMGRTPDDWDVASSALPEQVLALFPRALPTGLKHGTVTVLLDGGKVEVTTFRREGEYSDHRRPDSVRFDATLAEDLGRRDFTVNAMALGRDGALIDPYGGLADLEQKKIRCVGRAEDRFSEDALRMLRAVRFSARLGFTLDPDTRSAMARCAAMTAALAPERVREEVTKVITAPWPERGAPLFSLGLLAPWLEGPALPDLAALAALPNEPLIRWSGLCALLGSPALALSLRPDRKTAAVCARVVELLRGPAPGSGADWRRTLSKYGTDTVRAWAAVLGRLPELEAQMSEKPCLSVASLALSGGDLKALGLKGVEIGKAQRLLLEHVLSHPEDNTPKALAALLERAHGSLNNLTNSS